MPVVTFFFYVNMSVPNWFFFRTESISHNLTKRSLNGKVKK